MHNYLSNLIFKKYLLILDETESTTLFTLLFEAFRQKFSIAEKCLNVRNIECETNLADVDTSLHCETRKTISDSSELCTHVVNSEKSISL